MTAEDTSGDIAPSSQANLELASTESNTDTTTSKDATPVDGVSHSWNTIQDRLRTSVVSISTNRPMAFEEDSPETSYATGFVVDSEKGIILSNRHVMGTGPSFHKATFFGNQVVYLQPAYYDPVHDFAFFRYDPSEVQGIEPTAIRLAPEKARSGLEFRIVGNTSNERMSVHQGELSQLDRNAPRYTGNYSDFNTFYFQASSGSKGGSSGSPVVDIEGDAVAIKCGSKDISSTAYMLPLERVVYALDYVKEGLVPPRGTLQTVFGHVDHTGIGRLGLSPEMAGSEGIDINSTTGMLKIDKILPDGPAFNVLAVGDILISANGKAIPGFSELFEIMDASVDKQVRLRVFRKGQFCSHSVVVGNIYDITPSKLLYIGGALLCNISYHQAVKWSAPIYGVNIASDSNGFFQNAKYEECKIIYAANGKPTPNIDALMEVLRDFPRDKPVVIIAKDHRDLREEAVFVARHPLVTPPNILYTRSPTTGFWSIESYGGMVAAKEDICAAKSIDLLSGSDPEPGQPSGMMSAASMSVDMFLSGHGSQPFVQKVSNSAVGIISNSITPADGQTWNESYGSGLIIDKHQGIVLCNTETVKNPTCIVWIRFAGLVRVRAKLAYTHPLYPISFLKYNPKELSNADANNYTAIGEIDIRLQQDCQDSNPIAVGSSVTVVSGEARSVFGITASIVSRRRLLSLNTCDACVNQRYLNNSVFMLSPEPSHGGSTLGIVYNCDGHLCGIWVLLSYCRHRQNSASSVGLDISVVRSALEALQLNNSDVVNAHTLGVEFEPVALDTARVFGVNNSHISEVIRTRSIHEWVLFKVDKTLYKRDQTGEDSLEVGDIVLKVDGQLATRIVELACIYGRSSVSLTVLRNMNEIALTIKMLPLSRTGTRRIVYWAGILIQEPHEAALEKANRVASGVYAFWGLIGSPITQVSYFKGFITEIDDQPTQTLDDFVDVARRLKSKDIDSFNARVATQELFRSGKMPGCDVKIHIVSLTGEDTVFSIRTNDHYCPAWQIVRGPLADDDWVWEAI